MTKSYAPQVIADNTCKWYGNALRFATKEEAEAQVRDLAARWTSVLDTRVVETDDPVNYRYINDTLIPVEKAPEPLKCSICEGAIEVHGTWTQGHNAEPVNDGRCCDGCNAQIVIPVRIAQIVKSERRGE
jgi:hypothetical protein